MSEITYRPAWRLKDPQIERDAREFWTSLKIVLPSEIDGRLPDLCAGGYADGKMVAVSTAVISYLQTLKGRFAMYRCTVAPSHRRQNVAWQITVFSRDVLQQWSLEHPQEQVLGLAAALQAAEFGEPQRRPLLPEFGLNLNLVGYTLQGHQLRVSWFKHTLID